MLHWSLVNQSPLSVLILIQVALNHLNDIRFSTFSQFLSLFGISYSLNKRQVSSPTFWDYFNTTRSPAIAQRFKRTLSKVGSSFRLQKKKPSNELPVCKKVRKLRSPLKRLYFLHWEVTAECHSIETVNIKLSPMAKQKRQLQAKRQKHLIHYNEVICEST